LGVQPQAERQLALRSLMLASLPVGSLDLTLALSLSSRDTGPLLTSAFGLRSLRPLRCQSEHYSDDGITITRFSNMTILIVDHFSVTIQLYQKPIQKRMNRSESELENR
jgi:hypothetical protein